MNPVRSRGRGHGQERKMQRGSGCASLVGAATCIVFVGTKHLLGQIPVTTKLLP